MPYGKHLARQVQPKSTVNELTLDLWLGRLFEGRNTVTSAGGDIDVDGAPAAEKHKRGNGNEVE